MVVNTDTENSPSQFWAFRPYQHREICLMDGSRSGKVATHMDGIPKVAHKTYEPCSELWPGWRMVQLQWSDNWKQLSVAGEVAEFSSDFRGIQTQSGRGPGTQGPCLIYLWKKKKMVELWTTVRIDPLMPLTGPHLTGSEKPCCPPVFPKVLGCLPARGTPWGSFLYPQTIPRQKKREPVTFIPALLSLISWLSS